MFRLHACPLGERDAKRRRRNTAITAEISIWSKHPAHQHGDGWMRTRSKPRPNKGDRARNPNATAKRDFSSASWQCTTATSRPGCLAAGRSQLRAGGDCILKRLAQTHPMAQIAAQLGRSRLATSVKAHELGLSLKMRRQTTEEPTRCVDHPRSGHQGPGRSHHRKNKEPKCQRSEARFVSLCTPEFSRPDASRQSLSCE
jgi:hypothetical protein